MTNWCEKKSGFYINSNAEEYYECIDDPNPNTFQRYKKQCIEYEKILTGNEPWWCMYFEDDKFISEGTKKVVIHIEQMCNKRTRW